MYQNSLGMMASVLNTDPIPSVPKCNWCTKRNDCNKRTENDQESSELYRNISDATSCQCNHTDKCATFITTTSKPRHEEKEVITRIIIIIIIIILYTGSKDPSG